MQKQLQEWLDLTLVTDTWDNDKLPSHDQLVELFRGKTEFTADMYMLRLMDELNEKEQRGAGARRFAYKAILVRAIEIINEQGLTKSTVQVDVLGRTLNDLYESIDGFDELFAYILAQPMRRCVPAQLTTMLGTPNITEFQTKLKERTDHLERQFARFQAAMYVLEMEETTGFKGQWRGFVVPGSRCSLPAVQSLRKTHGIRLSEAKNTVEAYCSGMFK